MAAEDTGVQVAVRCRPFSKREIYLDSARVIEMQSGQTQITDPSSQSKDVHSFAFDHGFEGVGNQAVYAATLLSPAPLPRPARARGRAGGRPCKALVRPGGSG